MDNNNFAMEHVFTGNTVSEAWGHALIALFRQSAGDERSQILFLIEGNADTIENPNIRSAIDKYLSDNKETSVEDVSWTIFPHSIWRIHGSKGRKIFFDIYMRDLPRFVAASSKNKRGIYFARMIGFDTNPVTGARAGNEVPEEGNQLELVLRSSEKAREKGMGVHRAKLQVAVFDPARDHIPNPYFTFPCLQHITFEPDFSKGVLHTNAFYATQQLVRKAYGNLLGLYQLGNFMATEMGLRPGRLAVFVGVERLGDASKKHFASLVADVEQSLEEATV